MTYNHKTYKKCNFVRLAKSPLKPLKKADKSTKKYMAKSKELTEWTNGWFKGQYELNESEQ